MRRVWTAKESILTLKTSSSQKYLIVSTAKSISLVNAVDFSTVKRFDVTPTSFTSYNDICIVESEGCVYRNNVTNLEVIPLLDNARAKRVQLPTRVSMLVPHKSMLLGIDGHGSVVFLQGGNLLQKLPLGQDSFTCISVAQDNAYISCMDGYLYHLSFKTLQCVQTLLGDAVLWCHSSGKIVAAQVANKGCIVYHSDSESQLLLPCALSDRIIPCFVGASATSVATIVYGDDDSNIYVSTVENMQHVSTTTHKLDSAPTSILVTDKVYVSCGASVYEITI